METFGLFIIGIASLLLAAYGEQNYKKKVQAKTIKAKVVDVERKLMRDSKNFLIQDECKITVEYDGTNFVIHSSAYQVVTKNNIPIGVVANFATISLNTIHTIFDIVVEVINSAVNEDQSDAAESSEG